MLVHVVYGDGEAKLLNADVPVNVFLNALLQHCVSPTDKSSRSVTLVDLGDTTGAPLKLINRRTPVLCPALLQAQHHPGHPNALLGANPLPNLHANPSSSFLNVGAPAAALASTKGRPKEGKEGKDGKDKEPHEPVVALASHFLEDRAPYLLLQALPAASIPPEGLPAVFAAAVEQAFGAEPTTPKSGKKPAAPGAGAGAGAGVASQKKKAAAHAAVDGEWEFVPLFRLPKGFVMPGVLPGTRKNPKDKDKGKGKGKTGGLDSARGNKVESPRDALKSPK